MFSSNSVIVSPWPCASARTGTCFRQRADQYPWQGGNAIITPDFVTGGSAADLGKATEAYNQAKSNFEANTGNMNPGDKAVAVTKLAIAKASIIALDKVLAAQNGAPVDLAELIATDQKAQAELNSNRALLSAGQISEAEALLTAIATVISRVFIVITLH